MPTSPAIEENYEIVKDRLENHPIFNLSHVSKPSSFREDCWTTKDFGRDEWPTDSIALRIGRHLDLDTTSWETTGFPC